MRKIRHPGRKLSKGHVWPNDLHNVPPKKSIHRTCLFLLDGIFLQTGFFFHLSEYWITFFTCLLCTYPCSGSSIQLIFCAKFIKLVLCHMTVITTDKLKNNSFCLQDSILSSLIGELLDAPINGFLLLLWGNSFFAQTAPRCQLQGSNESKWGAIWWYRSGPSSDSPDVYAATIGSIVKWMQGGEIMLPPEDADIRGPIDDVFETYSFLYDPSLATSGMSITSYKTKKTVNSHKSHYNACPQHKYADCGHLRPQGFVPLDVDNTSVQEVFKSIECRYHNYTDITFQTELDEHDMLLSSPPSAQPTSPKPSPSHGTQPLDWPCVALPITMVCLIFLSKPSMVGWYCTPERPLGYTDPTSKPTSRGWVSHCKPAAWDPSSQKGRHGTRRQVVQCWSIGWELIFWLVDSLGDFERLSEDGEHWLTALRVAHV